jgi:small subunit ribosomal protein S6
MTAEYELILMLDPEAPDERREQISGEARTMIESAGELRHAETWGMRKMAFEIRQRNEAEYRFFRFQGQKPLLDQLDHNLKIADDVLRFRIFKVDSSTPLTAPPAGQAIATHTGRERGRSAERAPEPAAEVAEELAGDAAEPPGEEPAAAAADEAATPAEESPPAPAEEAVPSADADGTASDEGADVPVEPEANA